jgi:hypothetical protein
VEYEDYYEKADDKCLRIVEGAVYLSVTGKRRYKVGLRSPHLLGRVGYIKPVRGETEAKEENVELLVRAFQNDPSSEYVEEPDAIPGCRGLPFHVYNDGGKFGGFGELECNGRTISADIRSAPPRAISVDDFPFWYFQGPSRQIAQIAMVLLGNGSQGRNSFRG